MELKKGYKQTEVGVIPEDWDAVKLDDITIMITNGFVGTVTSEYSEARDSVLYIQGYNVEENSFNLNGVKRVSNQFHLKHKKSSLREGDILTIQTGDVGLTTYVPKEFEGSNCHALIISRFDRKTVYPKFISYYFNSVKGRERLREIETGSTMKHLNVGDMYDFLIPLPPTKEEQTAIATALSDADALIQNLEQLIAKKQLIKQGAMQELLTPKEGWEEKELGNVVLVLDNFRKPLSEKVRLSMSGNIPYCGANGIVGYIDSYIIEDEIILIAEDGGHFDEYLTRPIAYRMSGKCWVNNHAHIIKATNDNNQDFIYYSLVHKNILDYINGGTRAKLNKGELVKIPVNIPVNIDEQTHIANILSAMDEEIEALEQKLEKYKQIKQGMMQDLLTGRVRLT